VVVLLHAANSEPWLVLRAAEGQPNAYRCERRVIGYRSNSLRTRQEFAVLRHVSSSLGRENSTPKVESEIGTWDRLWGKRFRGSRRTRLLCAEDMLMMTRMLYRNHTAAAVVERCWSHVRGSRRSPWLREKVLPPMYSELRSWEPATNKEDDCLLMLEL